MKNKENNYAFIDSQNLNLSIRELGWRLDFGRFRPYLKDKYAVTKAFLFIGYVAGNETLYTSLQNMGYVCIFKPTLELSDGRVKGNVDAELVLHTMIELKNFDQAVLVSGDGDFYCLVEYLLKIDKLKKMIIPNQKQYSGLLKRLSSPNRNIFDFMNSLREKLKYRGK
ncbi:MAG: NYN domain-containing protein [Parcubacteria group bacterium]|uniref:NYN domain-containing protein n=1 Tax=Candidatus Sungiibacteriota bacterium TaxID=2750080 RepID=A0A931YDR1_9BACT|nr:NYN domain-containing protein [Candidatus Sungbacteria bacterium]MBI2466069.1 NYN domain-containing protein [Candidatus Sungbacteria bacterium]MBI4119087.1 NYN domain-containing protein [Parcubacteria group bacterium]